MSSQISRRRLIAVGAASVAATAVHLGPASVPATAEEPEGGRSPEFETTPARITSVDGTIVEVEPITPPAPGSWPATIALVGFPTGITARAGDHVSVVEDGESIDAAPLCSWVEGVPTEALNGGFTVGALTSLPEGDLPEDLATALRSAVTGSSNVRVCMLDTDLLESVVLDVRPDTPPPTEP